MLESKAMHVDEGSYCSRRLVEVATAADESCERKLPAVTYPLRGRSQAGEESTPADVAAKAADDG